MTLSEHTLTVAIDGADTDPKSASLTLDEGWSPYAQLELTVALTDMPALDPRGTPSRVIGQVRQDFGTSFTLADITADFGGLALSAMTTTYGTKPLSKITEHYTTPYNSTFLAGNSRDLDLCLRSVTPDFGNGTATIKAASDEALLHDYALIDTAPTTYLLISVRALISLVLSRIGAVLDSGTDDGTIEAGSAVWEPGVSAWDFLSPLVQKAGLRLWCDERRRWMLTKATTTTTPGDITLTHGTSAITELRDSIDRDAGDWADAAVVVYRWTDGAGASQVAYDTATSPGWSRVLRIEYTETPYPGPGAAAQILARRMSRGSQLSVRAVSRYDTAPGQNAHIGMPDATTQHGAVSAVTWIFPDDEMTITTRDLIGATA